MRHMYRQYIDSKITFDKSREWGIDDQGLGIKKNAIKNMICSLVKYYTQNNSVHHT